MLNREKTLSAGDLNRRVKFRRKTVVNGPLGATETWRDILTCWASRNDVSDGEKIAAGTTMSITRSRFAIRSSEQARALLPRDELFEGGRRFEIIGIKEIGRNDYLEITAETRMD